jgi:hypothetical protein
MMTYEAKLNRDLRWALEEGSMHFEKESAIHKTLEKITRRLNDLGIPYALVGAMALFFHGYRRFTEDVGLLVTPTDLEEIHRKLEGLGYVAPFTGSKQLRDADNGVRVEFITTGAYPGDGKPKPVSFPHPKEAVVVLEGIPCLQLPRLIELKLASGMTNPGRLKDLADVQEMIRILQLPKEAMSDQLNPFVRDKYWELWEAVQNSPQDL